MAVRFVLPCPVFLMAALPCPALSCPVPSWACGVEEQVTACSCKVGSIRIEVDGSKHDGFYNFLAKGLGDTIRCARRVLSSKLATLTLSVQGGKERVGVGVRVDR